MARKGNRVWRRTGQARAPAGQHRAWCRSVALYNLGPPCLAANFAYRIAS